MELMTRHEIAGIVKRATEELFERDPYPTPAECAIEGAIAVHHETLKRVYLLDREEGCKHDF